MADVALFYDELDVRARLSIPPSDSTTAARCLCKILPLFIAVLLERTALHSLELRPDSFDWGRAVSGAAAYDAFARYLSPDRLALARPGICSATWPKSTSTQLIYRHRRTSASTDRGSLTFTFTGGQVAQNNSLRILCFLIPTFFATLGARETPAQIVIWNVGQGQWVTIREQDRCWHLDMGGEFAPWPKIIEACRDALNLVSVSHWDSDHLSFVGRAQSALPNICLLHRPPGQPGDGQRRASIKSKAIDRLPPCATASPFNRWVNVRARTSNDNSQVLHWHGLLAPGDSSAKVENKWAVQLKGLAQIQVLILGHHGSRTSTSELLLSRLPNLRLAIASARANRYGHPHPEVLQRLRARRTPVLQTQDWGHIHLYL